MSLMDNSHARGVMLVELVIVLSIVGIVSAMAPALMSYGVHTAVMLPRTLATNGSANDVLHQAAEGGFSTLAGQGYMPGVRFASGSTPTDAPLWLAEGGRLGYRTADGRYILLRLSGEAVRRSVYAGASC